MFYRTDCIGQLSADRLIRICSHLTANTFTPVIIPKSCMTKYKGDIQLQHNQVQVGEIKQFELSLNKVEKP